MFILIALIVGCRSKCVSISGTSICDPYSDSFINIESLSKLYKTQIQSAESWQHMVQAKTSGGEAQSNQLINWTSTGNYRGELLQYYRSYVCLTDIFLLSTACNNTLQVAICEDVCSSVASAMKTMFAHSTHKVAGLSRRLPAIKSSCKSIAKRFNPVGTCIRGIDSDQNSCGTIILN